MVNTLFQAGPCGQQRNYQRVKNERSCFEVVLTGTFQEPTWALSIVKSESLSPLLVEKSREGESQKGHQGLKLKHRTRTLSWDCAMHLYFSYSWTFWDFETLTYCSMQISSQNTDDTWLKPPTFISAKLLAPLFAQCLFQDWNMENKP